MNWVEHLSVGYWYQNIAFYLLLALLAALNLDMVKYKKLNKDLDLN